MVLSAALAVGLQSSTAAIALVLGLAAGGVVDFEVALAAVIGANVGIGLSTLGLGWHRIEARRMALGNLLAKVALAAVLLSVLGEVGAGLQRLPVGLEQQIAVAHTAFNVILAATALPLLHPLERLVTWLVPDPPEGEEAPFGPRYIDRGAIESFSLGIGQSRREALRVSEIGREMLHESWKALEHRDVAMARHVQSRDDQVDLLDQEVKRFLSDLASRHPAKEGTAEIRRQLRFLNEMETIGDVIDKNLCELAVKRARRGLRFSDEGWAELEDLHKKVSENLLVAETAFATRDTALAHKLLRHKQRLGQYERALRNRHFDRLTRGVSETQQSSAVHLDLLTHLKRVNNYVSHVGYVILDTEPAPSESAAA
jgi:phosphate:Na+ symporter